MEASKAIAQISKGVIQQAYLVVGEQDFWARAFLSAVRTEWGREIDMEYHMVSGPTTWAEIGGLLGAGSLFQDRRLIVVQDAKWPKREEHLAGYLTDPVQDTVLVVWERHPAPSLEKIFGAERTVQAKALKGKPFLDFVARLARQHQVQLSREALQEFAGLVEGDEFHAQNEMQKMSLYQSVAPWDAAAVREFVVPVTHEHKIWQLTDPILARDAKTSLRMLDELLRGGHLPLVLLISVARMLGQLSRAHIAQHSGRTLQSFQADEKLHAFVAKKIWQAASRWSSEELDRALQQAMSLDYAFKRSQGEPEIWLGVFVALLG